MHYLGLFLPKKKNLLKTSWFSYLLLLFLIYCPRYAEKNERGMLRKALLVFCSVKFLNEASPTVFLVILAKRRREIGGKALYYERTLAPAEN